MATLTSKGTARTVVSTTKDGICYEDRVFPAGSDQQAIKMYISERGGRVVLDVVLFESEGLMHSGPQRLVVPSTADLDAQAGALGSGKWSRHVVVTRFITLAS